MGRMGTRPQVASGRLEVPPVHLEWPRWTGMWDRLYWMFLLLKLADDAESLMLHVWSVPR